MFINVIIANYILSIIFLPIIGIIKEKANAPRPIFYAMEIFSRVHPSLLLRERISRMAHQSFPSGHSSCIAAGLIYVAVVLLGDAHRLLRRSPFGPGGGCNYTLASRCLLYCALGLLMVVLWVGATRIIDYWHFANDVIGM